MSGAGVALLTGHAGAELTVRRAPASRPGPTTPMPEKRSALADTLTCLERASAAELRTIWRAERGTAPPPTLSARLMRLALAWDVQFACQSAQKPDREWGQIAKHRASGAAAAEAVHDLKAPPAPAGTRLLKEWGGVTHEVVVLAKGVQWRGRTYSSLSAVARAITGNTRNGPQFFGLRGGRA